jgi:hypothetical protein
MRAALAIAMLLAPVVAWSSPPAAAGDAPATAPAAAEAPLRFDGRSAESFAESRAAIEAEMGDTAKFAFHMKLAQVRAKLAEQRGRPLTDAEFAAALDGKTLAELDATADAAPTHITIDIETSDDT